MVMRWDPNGSLTFLQRLIVQLESSQVAEESAAS
jgi:hypothetical protein